MKNVEIIFEDKDIIVAYKPAGLAVQTRSLTSQDMVSFLANYRASRNEDTYIGILSRLDQPVEGLMVFGKNKTATARLSKDIQNKNFKKTYIAAIRDFSLSPTGRLEDYLLKDGRTNTSKVVAQSSNKQAKKAVLDYSLLAIIKDISFIEIELHTGRHHQIRVQFASRNCPLFGDMKYASLKRLDQGMEESSCDKWDLSKSSQLELGLCAYKLSFIHPTTKEEMSFSIEPKNEIFKDYFIE